jgi:hypothetical protein
MRLTCFALVVVTIVGLTSSYAAAAQSANSTKSSYQYDTCSCRFGYGNVCILVASCESAGGHCLGSCTPQAYDRLSNR